MEQARSDFTAAVRRPALTQRANAWREANYLRDYVLPLGAAASDHTDFVGREQFEHWIDWAAQLAP